MGVYAQENQRRHGRPSGAVGRKTLQVVLIQKLGSNGVSRVRHCRTPGLCQNDKQLGADIVGCGGDVGVTRTLRAGTFFKSFPIDIRQGNTTEQPPRIMLEIVVNR